MLETMRLFPVEQTGFDVNRIIRPVTPNVMAAHVYENLENFARGASPKFIGVFSVGLGCATNDSAHEIFAEKIRECTLANLALSRTINTHDFGAATIIYTAELG
ncbi:MAG: hypothetical protein M3P98_02545 [bacterium]|nr:hypothetical protein [bacterium]